MNSIWDFSIIVFNTSIDVEYGDRRNKNLENQNHFLSPLVKTKFDFRVYGADKNRCIDDRMHSFA